MEFTEVCSLSEPRSLKTRVARFPALPAGAHDLSIQYRGCYPRLISSTPPEFLDSFPDARVPFNIDLFVPSVNDPPNEDTDLLRVLGFLRRD
jgi:hypothetical protein